MYTDLHVDTLFLPEFNQTGILLDRFSKKYSIMKSIFFSP